MSTTRERRRAASRRRVRRQRRIAAGTLLGAIGLAAGIAASIDGHASHRAHSPAARPISRTGRTLVAGGPLAPASVGGLAALWAPQNVVGIQPGTAAAYRAAAERPGPAGYLLVADRGNNRILVLSPQGQVVFRYP